MDSRATHSPSEEARKAWRFNQESRSSSKIVVARLVQDRYKARPGPQPVDPFQISGALDREGLLQRWRSASYNIAEAGSGLK